MKSIEVTKLIPGSYFSAPVYLDKDYILLTTDTPVTMELITRLKRWNYKNVFTEGEQIEKPEYMLSKKEENLSTIEEDINEKQKSEEARNFYFTLIDFTKQMFELFLTENQLNQNSITKIIKELIEIEKDNRDNLLRLTELRLPTNNYIIPHCANTAILSVSMGSFLKLPPHKMIELGIAALLHDIGMLKLPEKIYMSKNKLTPQEQKAIVAHTILGYRILKGFSVPDNVALAALEHHERIDGSGYPNGLKGEKISLYAKIIAVACSYEAAITARPFRDQLNGHQAILDLLKGNRTKYDEAVFRALIYRLSLYPLGTFVLLSNGTKGMVVKANPNDPKNPYVRILQDENGEIPEKNVIIKISKDSDVTIQRTLTKSEISQMQFK